MNRISVKLLTALAIFLFIAIIPMAVLATNENVSVVSKINEKSETEYIIYIKDYTDKNFKYAFTTNANPEEMDLSYINSISDLGENQVAFLDTTTYEELSKNSATIYMWAKDESENLILKGSQLDLNQALSEEKIDNVETLTKRIEVKIADTQEDATTVRNENIDGVDEVANVGYVEILDDDKKATYYYERTKLPDAEKYNQLMILAEKINNEYDGMDMYEKIQFGTEFNELYSKVINEAKWEKVEDTRIHQPETSEEGDQYIVLLKKVSKVARSEETTYDVQFLTAHDNYEPNVVIEEVIVQETAKLPITYDSIALFVILGVIVILVIAVFMRMRNLSKKNEEK